MSTPSSSTRLKYSKRLSALGAASVAVLGIGSVSAAVSAVGTDLLMPTFVGYLSFSPQGNSWVSGYDNSFPGIVRNCGLNLMSTQASNFQWTSGAIAWGSVVDAAQTYNSSSSFFLPYPGTDQTVYVGYRFQNQGPSNDETYYGYITVVGCASQVFTIESYHYENSPNTAITVPEPSAALFGLAGVGFAFTRRRRA